MKIDLALQKIGLWLIAGTIFILPWFFLPITSEFYDFNKNALLIISTLALLALWVIMSIVDRQVRITRSPLALPILSLATVWLAGAILRSPNRVEAFLQPGQAGTWLALAFFFFTVPNFVRHKKEIEILVISAVSSIVLVSISTVLFTSGAILRLSLPAFMNSHVWSPTGSMLTAGLAIAAVIPLLGYLVVRLKSQFGATLAAIALLVIFIGGGATVYRLINPAVLADRAVFLPQVTGWGIALEALKVSPLLGTGPATFFSDFTRFRPVAFNLTPNWNLRFTSSSNYYLHLLSTLGVFGLAAYLFLVSRSYQLLRKATRLNSVSGSSHSNVLAVASGLGALACFVLQLFFPFSLVLLFLTVVYLVILVSAVKLAGTAVVHEASVDIVAAGSAAQTPILPWIVAVLVLTLTGVTLYLGSRAYAAEIWYYKALQAANKGNGLVTYDSLATALKRNPFVDDYRVTFSRTSLLLASSIARNPDLKDADRNNISQLAQQAIREAKNAVALNPNKVTNVENLAIVYRNLLNVAQGADAWTIAAYRQAIVLDPTNPNLRIVLGGVFYSQKNYDDAIRLFQQSADLKPDLANAHYNLASAYRQKGDLEKAVAELQNVVQLVDKSTSDYDKATQELADLQKQLPPAKKTPAAPTTGSQLNQPEPLPTPAINPPLQLDQSLSPESPATPSTDATPR